MTAVQLTECDRSRLRQAHAAYRATYEAVERCCPTPDYIRAALDRHNAALTKLLRVMAELGVGSLDEVFTPSEMDELLD